MIAAGGNWLNDLLVDDSVSSVQVELTKLFGALSKAQDAAIESGDIIECFYHRASSLDDGRLQGL